ncbi:MAG: DUF4340 domain-containing protein [Clostridia bacterium]|nr:DUF4340 domain-containing protein [Clostridia bacterium]
MSKRVRTMLISLVLLAAVGLCAAVVLLLPDNTPTPDETQTTTTTAAPDIVIVDKRTDENGKTAAAPVTGLTVENAQGSFDVVHREDGSMAVESYSDLQTDTVAIAAMCDDVAYLTAAAKPTAQEDEAAYGFDKPTATVTAHYYDGTSAVIVFGAESKGTEGYYCRVDGDDTLYIVDTATVEQFLVDGKALIGKTLIVPPTKKEDDKSGAPSRLNMWLTGSLRSQPVEIVTDTEGAYPSLTYVSTYIMKSPYLRAVDSDNFYTVAQTMTSLVAAGVECVRPSTKQLAEYGLDDPYSVAAFTLAVTEAAAKDGGGTTVSHYNDREHMVLLGDKNDDGEYYALVDGADIVYRLSADSVPWAELTAYDVMSKLLFMKDITTIDEIAVTDEGVTTAFALTHKPDAPTRNEQMIVTAGDKTYDTAQFRILYQLLLSIRRVGEKEADATADEPVMKLKVTFNDGEKPLDIAFYPMTASRYLCVFGDGEQSAVSISAAEAFLKQYRHYLNGVEVTSPY